MADHELTEEEHRTAEVIEIYRAEHTTWNLERLRSIFADNPTLWLREVAHEGHDAVDEVLVRWCSRRGIKMDMQHGRVAIQGNLAAAEWVTTGMDPNGTPIDMAGMNVYELENGRIKYLHIYQAR